MLAIYQSALQIAIPLKASKNHFSLLHEWIGKNPVEIVTSGDGRLAVAINNRPAYFADVAPGIRLRVESADTSTTSLRELHYRFDHRIWLHFEEARPLAAIREDVSKLLPLLCLLTGERIFSDTFVLFEDDPFESHHPRPVSPCELLQINRGVSDAERGTHPSHMRVTFQELEPQFGQVFEKWFRCYETLKPVVELYFSVTAGWVPTTESRFLFIAQALEVYHARSPQFSQTERPRESHKTRLKAILKGAPKLDCKWLNEKLAFSNQKTLAQRLDDLLKQHPDEARELTMRIPDFASKLRYTRNYYTHYNPEHLKKGKVAIGNELSLLTCAVETLLEICLLKELGIHGKPIQRVLQRFTGMEVSSLETTQPHPKRILI